MKYFILLQLCLLSRASMLQKSQQQCEVRVVQCEEERKQANRSTLLTGKQGRRGVQGLVGPPGPPGRPCNDSYVNELRDKLTGLELENVVMKGQLDLLINCILPEIDHSTTPTSKIQHGDHVRYTCNEGYSTSDRTNRRCRKGEIVPTFENVPLVCYPESCHVIKQNEPEARSGIYKIKQSKHNSKIDEFYCDLDGEKGWTVIHRRYDGSLNFNQNWQKYKEGFGDKNGEFWIGNDNLHQLTDNQDQMLRIDVVEKANNNKYYATYNYFYIGDESRKYFLVYDGYSGNGGDGMTYFNSQYFSTNDRDYDRTSSHCAASYQAGWWFEHCHTNHVHSPYTSGNYQWYNYKIRSSIMKIGKRD